MFSSLLKKLSVANLSSLLHQLKRYFHELQWRRQDEPCVLITIQMSRKKLSQVKMGSLLAEYPNLKSKSKDLTPGKIDKNSLQISSVFGEHRTSKLVSAKASAKPKRKSPARTQKLELRTKTRLEGSSSVPKPKRPASQIKVKSSNHKEISVLLKSTRIQRSTKQTNFYSNKYQQSSEKSPRVRQSPNRQDRLSQASFFNTHCAKRAKDKSQDVFFRGADSWQAGDLIRARFQTIELLGRGAFGIVLKCYDIRQKQEVAIKIIEYDRENKQTLLCEVEMLQYLKKCKGSKESSLVLLRDTFADPRYIYIVFDVLSCSILRTIQDRRQNPQEFARRVAVQLLNGLGFMKRYEVLHCDLKPENVLLLDPEKSGVRIIDLGSSCFFREKEEYFQTNQYIQSRFYRAPEVIMGGEISYPIDMWSTGCIVAELVLGTPLFPGHNSFDQVGAIAQVLGDPPEYFLKNCKLAGLYFDRGGRLKNSSRVQGMKSIREIFSDCDLELIDFLESVLQWQPKLRLDPAEALHHRWLASKVTRQSKLTSSLMESQLVEGRRSRGGSKKKRKK